MVTGNVTDPTSMTFVLPKPTKGSFDGLNHYLPILVYWKAK